jgi:NTP pyrophosphatase (non-canonical NTP hydrolase)
MAAMSETPVHELHDLRDRLRAFAAARDWAQYHTPRNLAVALSVEAAELLEPFRWSKTGELSELSEQARGSLAHELADVLICLVQLADKADVDLYRAALDKLAHNEANYPAERVRGDSRKYSEY